MGCSDQRHTGGPFAVHYFDLAKLKFYAYSKGPADVLAGLNIFVSGGNLFKHHW